jgi:hypothetical protein
VGISGKMGSGKNYIAEKVLPPIIDKYIKNAQYYYLAFGDQIKVELGCRHKELNYDVLFNKKTKEVRQLLQKYGTEEGRCKYGEDIWIRSMQMWMDIFKGRNIGRNNVFIITDVRFRNEADWIRSQNGVLIRIDAPKRTSDRVLQEGSDGIQNHSSEVDLDAYEFKYIVNNDPEYVNTIEEQVQEIARRVEGARMQQQTTGTGR